MDKGTFGCTRKYKTLEFLIEKISMMDDKDKNYLSSIIQDINIKIKKAEIIKEHKFRKYILNLINIDFVNKINMYVKPKYDIKISTYLINFLNAKIKNSNKL